MIQAMANRRRQSPEATDAALIRGAKAGDPTAWAAVIDRYSAYVYGLLRSARVPEADQPDGFQYVFVELFKALPKLAAEDHLRPWLRQTTLRQAVKLRDGAAKAPMSLEIVEPFLFDDDLAGDLEQMEMRQTVRDAVHSLTDRCQELVKRLFFADPPTPYAEVAKQLGIKIQSISMTRQRCLDDLERILRSRGVT